MLSSMRSSFHSRIASTGAASISWSAYTKARSPTRMATPSPKRRDSPAQPCRSVLRFGESAWVVGCAAPRRGIVHHVVVEQGERMHQFERRTGVDVDLVVGRRRRRRRIPSGRTPAAAACRRRAPVGRSRRSGARGRCRGRPTGHVPTASRSASLRVDPVGETAKGRRRRPWHGAAETNGLRVRQRFVVAGRWGTGTRRRRSAGSHGGSDHVVQFGAHHRVDQIFFRRFRRSAR